MSQKERGSVPGGFPFAIQRTRGSRTPKLVHSLVLAEFDIGEGSTVRHSYPSLPNGLTADQLADYMLPEGCHNQEVDWTVFLLNRDKPALETEAITFKNAQESADEDHLLYCLSLVKTKVDSKVRRGAVVKALALVSPYHFLEMFRPVLILTLDHYQSNPSPELLSDLYSALNSDALHPAEWAWPSRAERSLMSRNAGSKAGVSLHKADCAEYQSKSWHQRNQLNYMGLCLELNVPLYSSPDHLLGTPDISLLVMLFGTQTMKIYNAVLAGKRVMFVGYNQAAERICKLVLAACAMVSPPLTGVARRAFPYAMLSDLSFLEVPGYLAGSTNPMFEQRAEWWDVLCTVDFSQATASCITAEEKREQQEKRSRDERGRQHSPGRENLAESWPLDLNFIEKVIGGIEASLGEGWVAKMFHQYTQDILDQELDWKSSGSVNKAADSTNDPSKSDWRLVHLQEHMDLRLMENPWAEIASMKPEDGVKLRDCVRLLVASKTLQQAQVIYIFETIQQVIKSEEEIQVLLSLLPEEKGGLYPIAVGLLSPSPRVKQLSYRILRLIEKFPSTCPAVGTLNFYLRVSFSQFHIVYEEESSLDAKA